VALMLEILFFESAHDVPTIPADIEAVLLDQQGVVLEGASGDDYRPGHWRDAATGASAVIDVGIAPIEDDPIHPPTAYDGWRPLHLGVQIPVTGPHWQCVEALCFIERLLERLPQARALDTEDTGRDGETAGPRTWNRPRALASWERLHEVYCLGRQRMLRMPRLTSVCLWRYRRERLAGMARHGHLRWPEALALLDTATGMVCSACFWEDPTSALALAPVDLLIVRRGDRTGLIASASLTAAAAPIALDCAGAAVVMPSATTVQLHDSYELLPATRFKALDDADWTD
jgi:hypothetical protein